MRWAHEAYPQIRVKVVGGARAGQILQNAGALLQLHQPLELAQVPCLHPTSTSVRTLYTLCQKLLLRAQEVWVLLLLWLLRT